MKGYVDVFLLSIPKKKIGTYKKIAKVFAAVVKDLGAVYYKEWVADDVNDKMLASFGRAVKVKSGEVIISSVVEYRNKKHRDQTNKKMMTDPRMLKLMKSMKTKFPFDMKRMVYGGFKPIVEMKRK